MKIIRFLLIFLITIALTLALNSRINGIPPIGKLLDPFNGFWQNAEFAEDIPTIIHPEGLSSPVKVVYDDRLIPHIFAENEKDLFYAQGYVVASHRLWQMETQTMLPAGRLSEILGEELLETDRLSRRRGMTYGAQNALKEMQKDSVIYQALISFSAGVNAYISSLDYAGFPIEYKLLDYEPEPWTPLKTALLLKYMAANLSLGEEDIENTNFLKLFGRNMFDLLYPERQAGDRPIIPQGHKWNFVPEKPEAGDALYFERYISDTYPRPNPNNGSNNWAVNGQLTSTGNPILCNDTHLELNLPSPWYLMQLNAPGINVFGATIPGALGVITGHNDSIAWGVTNAKQDVVDWYKITFRDEEKREYKYDNKWLKTQKIVEKFEVRGGKTFYDTILYTHYGPVVFDETFRPESRLCDYAMKWTAHDPSLEQKTFYLLNKAGNYQDYVEALSYYDCPAQNFIFASVKNEIAITVNGKFPVKWKEQGKFLMDGSVSAHEWQTFIPRDQLPRSYNPARGFLFSANQYPVDSLYPYYVYDYNYEDFRNRRIYDRLTAMKKPIDIEAMMSLQNDNFNYQAYLSLPLLLSHLDSASLSGEEREAYRLTASWDYFNHANLKAPSVYEVWWDFIEKNLWDEISIDTIALSKPEPINTIRIIRDHPEAPFIDNLSTPEKETLPQLIRDSYSQAVDSLIKWKEQHDKDFMWGEFKSTNILHLLRLASFSYENIQVGGNEHIVNANGSRHGVSLRIITQLGPQMKTWTIYPGGQSGNPGSPYYGNLLEMWRDGRYIEALFLQSPNENSEHILFTQTMQP